jgi:muconolactone delta-isomerase
MEFLVHMEVIGIEGGPEAEKALREKEAIRALELAKAGMLRRLWRVPGRRENWGIWSAEDADQLHDALVSLPLFAYLTITVHPLASHPNDPMRFGRIADLELPRVSRAPTTVRND